MFNVEETLKYLLNGAEDINDINALREKLEEVNKEGRTLRIKFGMDPSAPDIHLGHAVALRKIKQLQDLGHTAVVIIGDFTGAIGDPTGKSKTRNQLTDEQVKYNAQTYLEQIFKVIDKDKTELHYNSEWFANMSFKDVINLCSKTTVARMLERDDFNNRMNNHKPIAIHEFFYPLMQAYDSVEVKSDLELGGTDQTFNVMMGRNIQKDFGVAQQVPVFIPLLVGLDGKEKMSKSLGNYIGVDESPEKMYEKAMRIPDDVLLDYFKLTTDLDMKDVENMMSEDILLAHRKYAEEIIKMYHGEEFINQAEERYNTVAKGGIPENIEIFEIKESMLENGLLLTELLNLSNIVSSKSEGRRMIEQNGISVNGTKENDVNKLITTTDFNNDELIIQKGKKQFKKIVLIK